MSGSGWHSLIPGSVYGKLVHLEVVEQEGTEQLDSEQQDEGETGVTGGDGREEGQAEGGGEDTPVQAGGDERPG